MLAVQWGDKMALGPHTGMKLLGDAARWQPPSALTLRVAMAMRTAMVGTRAPNFSLLCTEGARCGAKQISLDDYLDRWLLLLFYSRDFSLV